jgi:hypothetical protein
MLPELSYFRAPYSCSLVSMEEVGERLCYMLEVTLPDGNRFQEYYDVESGLKLQKVQSGEAGPGGAKMSQTSTFDDYRTVESGIKLPHALSISMGPQPLKLNLDVARVNSAIPDADFKPSKK